LTLLPIIDKQIEQFVFGRYSAAFLAFLTIFTLAVALAVSFKPKTKVESSNESKKAS